MAAAAARGDQTAFNQLIRLCGSYIYKVAYRIVLDEQDALDVTQNAYYRIASKIGDFKGTGTFRSWAASIATREAISHLRKPHHREIETEAEVLSLISEADAGRSAKNPHESAAENEDREILLKAFESLSEQQRGILTLRLLEGIGAKEIASVLDIPATQVRSQTHRAMDRIKGFLKRTLE